MVRCVQAEAGLDTAGQRIPVEAGVTAVMAANDQMALGVIRALTERGFRVPDDVSVAGMDDTPEWGFSCRR